ncbi:myosin-binding protein C, fast-type, partial [Chelonia mydas]|uniref:myosin-binding protein C, fast-type n=1 Tax=Chelonia mydas TaxID=8469 RepID=UPI001CA92941
MAPYPATAQPPGTRHPDTAPYPATAQPPGTRHPDTAPYPATSQPPGTWHPDTAPYPATAQPPGTRHPDTAPYPATSQPPGTRHPDTAPYPATSQPPGTRHPDTAPYPATAQPPGTRHPDTAPYPATSQPPGTRHPDAAPYPATSQPPGTRHPDTAPYPATSQPPGTRHPDTAPYPATAQPPGTRHPDTAPPRCPVLTPVSPSAADPKPQDKPDETPSLFLQKPGPILVECGKEVALEVQVDGSQLSAKPSIKWFKGKWLELGIKSGLRFQFKETFDKEKKVYTFELRIGKVVIGDRGDYRCEVTSKEKSDTCTFNIDVEAPRTEESGNVLQAFKRTGEGKDKVAGELDFSGLLKKREVQVEEKKKKKKDDEEDAFPPEIWELLKGVTKKSEYERIAFQYGITDLRGMLKRLKKAKVEVKKSAAFTRKLDPAYQVDKGNRIKLVVEISDPDLPIKWYKNGQEIKPSAKYVFENVGKKRILTINKCTLADDAAYECAVADEKLFTELFVKEPPVVITKGLDDHQVFVGDRVELEVEVSEDGAQVMWMKDGVELTRDTAFKYRFKKDGKKHYLIINEATLEDSGQYKVMTNGGQSEAELVVEEKQLEVLQDIADLTVKAAEQAEFKCEVSDEKVTGKWYKNGVEVRPSKRIHITHKGRWAQLWGRTQRWGVGNRGTTAGKLAVLE